MKNWVKLFLCFMITFLLVGCSLSKENVDKTNNGSSKSKTNTLEKFVENNKEAVENFSNDVLDATLIARDDSLVYAYTYKNTFDESVLGTMKNSLESSINNQSEVFEADLKTARAFAPNTKSLIIEYYNGDGTLITSIEFK